MAVATTTIIAGIGLAIGAAGTVATMKGQEAAASASNRAEDLRKKQMALDSARQRRQIIREGVMARSTALANATAQGAAGGTGLQGGYGQIAGNTGSNLGYNNQSTQIGYQMFDVNKQITNGQTLASMGQGITGFGNTLLNNSQQMGRVGNYFMNQGT